MANLWLLLQNSLSCVFLTSAEEICAVMTSHPIGITVGVMQISTVCQRPFLFSPRVLSFTLTHVFFLLLSSNVIFTAADIFGKSFHLLSLEIWFYHLDAIQWTNIYFGDGGQTVAWAGMSLTYLSGIFNLINLYIYRMMHFSHWNNSLIWIILHFAIFFKHSVCRYGLLNFCTYLDTCTMCFFSSRVPSSVFFWLAVTSVSWPGHTCSGSAVSSAGPHQVQSTAT